MSDPDVPPGPFRRRDAVPTDGSASSPTSDLAPLLAESLDPLFARPSRLGVDSAWYGHVPFAGWLVRALRPSLLVELGTHAGVSYSAFCDQVAACGLGTRCFAVDGWTGDEHAGFYGQSVLDELRVFHDQRHAGFSRLLQMRFNEALPLFGDGEIDLLHIDGRHRYEDVAGDYESWLPKLSPGAVVLFHDTNVRERGFGVWRLWKALRRRHPGFEFLHGYGLGVLAPGSAPPAALAGLFGAGPDDTARLRERFAVLGERWQADYDRVLQERVCAALSGRAVQAEAVAASLGPMSEERDRLAVVASGREQALHALSHAHDRLRDELAVSKADRHRLVEAAARRDQAERKADEDRRGIAGMLADSLAAHDRARSELAGLAARLETSVADAASAQALVVAMQARADRSRGETEATIAGLRQALEAAERRAENGARTLAALEGSTSWRVTAPLRTIRSRLRRTTGGPVPVVTVVAQEPLTPLPAPVVVPVPEPAPAVVTLVAPPAPIEPERALPTNAEAPETPTLEWRPVRRILFVAGEPGTPGAVYRTERNRAACAAVGYETELVDIHAIDPDNVGAADLIVLWRAAHSGHIQTLLDLARAARTRVAFDVDDLIVQPSLAVAEIIDGIRTTFVTEAEGRSYFQAMQRTLTNCDLCTTTTEELAGPAGALHPVVHVVPNSFDAATERASRRAVRLRGERSDGCRVRIGYAGGTRTHQKDMATIAPALARVLEARPETLLVLFRDRRSGEGLVLIEEFPELVPFADRIEWRDMVALAELPGELARFDVSLCPLERGNPFCEAKSELKFFESALAGVCLVATPTGPFRRAVQDGVTGFLPEDVAGWEAVLSRLVDDPGLRRRVARDAYHDSLWQFGPRRQAELWSLLLAGLNGGEDGARASELSLRRGAYRAAGLPEVPGGEVLYSYDALGEASVTVGMTSYNYEAYIGEALESVAAQTLDSIDLVVVDDGSRDGSVALLLDWAERNRLRFNRLRILRTAHNAGLGGARNLVFAEAETPWIMVLDSDNRLAPDACARLLAAVQADGLAGFAYPLIRQFGASETVMGEDVFDPRRLASGNHIDAMALVAKWAWAAAGGYYVRRDAMGWEDFSLWCRLVELGMYGIQVPDELASYRVHAGSMVNAITERDENKRAMVGFVERRHPWLRLRMRATRVRR